MKTEYIIYKATSRTSGKSYIGMTAGNLEHRKYKHENAAINGSTCHFGRALRLYGFNDFDWAALDTAETQKELARLEIMWIKSENSYTDGYNSTLGGEGNRGPHSAETKKKISEAATGRVCSEETKRKISLAMKGKKGKKRSEEARRKASLAQKGRPVSAAVVQARVGKKRSEETKRKMSLAHKGKRKSEETKRRMSLARRAVVEAKKAAS